uniref:Uncharacterized protein n=1 Tax=Oryza rufipogon TaxID=4529 RepID=A0A0E0NZ04_ORYRU
MIPFVNPGQYCIERTDLVDPATPPSWILGLIVFDPIVSPHYEVFMIPFVNPEQYCIEIADLVLKESEWPPSPLILHVFSSAAERWEERSFVREGDSAGTVAYAQRQCHLDKRGNFYWRGALYVNSYFLMRFHL